MTLRPADKMVLVLAELSVSNTQSTAAEISKGIQKKQKAKIVLALSFIKDSGCSENFLGVRVNQESMKHK